MFEATEYVQSQSFRGDRRSALEPVKVALLGQGFEITRCSDEKLEARGPGMNSPLPVPGRHGGGGELSGGSPGTDPGATLG